MGLKEKQAIANLDFGWSEKSLKSATGNDIKIELDAATFNDDIDAIMYADQKGAMAAANGISKVCHNDIGKEAFNGLKVGKVKLVNHKEAGAKKVAVNSGVLELHGTWGANSDYFSEGEVRDQIENML
jgi:hypothetical protein